MTLHLHLGKIYFRDARVVYLMKRTALFFCSQHTREHLHISVGTETVTPTMQRKSQRCCSQAFPPKYKYKSRHRALKLLLTWYTCMLLQRELRGLVPSPLCATTPKVCEGCSCLSDHAATHQAVFPDMRLRLRGWRDVCKFDVTSVACASTTVQEYTLFLGACLWEQSKTRLFHPLAHSLLFVPHPPAASVKCRYHRRWHFFGNKVFAIFCII